MFCVSKEQGACHPCSCSCRYFDAARSYGKAEEFLAGWLEARGVVPGTVLVGSKWGYTYTADWRVSCQALEGRGC